MMPYHNRHFRAVSNSDNGEVDRQTTFHYRQQDNILWATYKGTNIRFGTITGIVHEDGRLIFTYQHLNQDNDFMTGRCESRPEELPNGKIRLHESWQWTCADFSKGESIVEEI
ncbi:MAG: n-acetylglutamate synthase [Bacteroidota bacterium]